MASQNEILKELKSWGEVSADKPNPQKLLFLAQTLGKYEIEKIRLGIFKHFEHSKFFPHLADLKPLIDADHGRDRPLPPPVGQKQLTAPPLSFEKLKRLASEKSYGDLQKLVRGAMFLQGNSEISMPAMVKKAIREVAGEEMWAREEARFGKDMTKNHTEET